MSAPMYSPPTVSRDVDLDLSRNEGRPTARDLVGSVSDPSDLIRRYPNTSALQDRLAELHGVASDQVLVTAGGDDALFRCFLARLGPGRTAVSTTPTFQMIPVYAGQVGARLIEIGWRSGPFPVADVAVSASGAEVVFVVSPNNPTGAVITENDLRELSSAAELVVLDAAYGEFANEDVTPIALELGNVVVIRTLSKAYGLAGLRVGYLLGSPDLVAEMSRFGSPYAVSTLSTAIALERLDRIEDVTAYVSEVRGERSDLADLLDDLGVESLPSQGNFVLAEVPDAARVTAACESLGVGIRYFPDRAGLENSVRITVPGDLAAYARLARTLRTVLAPDHTTDLKELLP
ncbi:MAG: histidinol-phosphate transaminase [Actinomycetota bacterium]